MDATQCTTDDVMNTSELVLSFPAKWYPYYRGKNLKIFKNGNSGDSQDFCKSHLAALVLSPIHSMISNEKCFIL